MMNWGFINSSKFSTFAKININIYYFIFNMLKERLEAIRASSKLARKCRAILVWSEDGIIESSS